MLKYFVAPSFIDERALIKVYRTIVSRSIQTTSGSFKTHRLVFKMYSILETILYIRSCLEFVKFIKGKLDRRKTQSLN